MLASLHYLDCTTPMNHLDSLNPLVKSIKLKDARFTGERPVKNVATTLTALSTS